jgi:hypothetical protein
MSVSGDDETVGAGAAGGEVLRGGLKEGGGGRRLGMVTGGPRRQDLAGPRDRSRSRNWGGGAWWGREGG